MDLTPLASTAPAQPSRIDPMSVDGIAAPNLSGLTQLGSDMAGYMANWARQLWLELTSQTVWLQVAAILVALGIAYALIRFLRTVSGSFFADLSKSFGEGRYNDILQRIVFPALSAGLLWLIVAGFSGQALPVELIRIAAAVTTGWALAFAAAAPRGDQGWRRGNLIIIVLLVGLAVLRLWSPFLEFIDSLMLPFGTDLSLLDVLRALLIGVVLIWSASFVSRFVGARLSKSARMTPSVSGLFGQLVRIVMIGAAVVISLRLIGVDLTALAVFTGALGVGIGFGLQSIFQNFVAGIIIIFERTLKVGDFIDIDGEVRGEVKEINIRSTLIRTNDNIDMLVPNSEFVNNRVINWTLREAKRRLHVPVGVAYGSDKDLVKKAILEAADQVEFTLKGVKSRQPDVWLVNFGDSSLDFELIVWLTDEATKKPARVHAAYCWAIDTALAKYGITIPFPQRDLHIIQPAGA